MIGSPGLLDGCVSQSIESLARECDEVSCKALDRLTPKRTRTIIRRNAPWYNEEIAIQKRKRRRLECKWRSTGFEMVQFRIHQNRWIKIQKMHLYRVSLKLKKNIHK